MSIPDGVVMTGVLELDEEYPVEFSTTELGEPVVIAYNEGHNNRTVVDLHSLLVWLRAVHPEYLKEQ
jgi:hypothetical protein